MNYRQIVSHQLEEAMKRESHSVLNYSTGKLSEVIFRKFASGKGTQERRKIYYRHDGSIMKSDILKYDNDYYLVINQDSKESEIYYGSVINKCNELWNISGCDLPMIVGDLDSATPRNGQMTVSVSGIIILYTKDIPDLHSKMILDTELYTNGGIYKIVNTYYVNGLAYLYLSREKMDTSITFDLINDSTNFTYKSGQEINQGWYVKSTTNTIYIPEAKLTFASSDPSVGYVNSNGKIVMVKAGTFDLTVTANYVIENSGVSISKTLTKTQTYTVNDSVVVNNSVTVTTPSTTIYIDGSTKKITAAYLQDGIENTLMQPTAWEFKFYKADKVTEITDYTNLSDFFTYSYYPSGTTNTNIVQVKLLATAQGNGIMAGDYVKCTAKYSDNLTGSIMLTVANL